MTGRKLQFVIRRCRAKVDYILHSLEVIGTKKGWGVNR